MDTRVGHRNVTDEVQPSTTNPCIASAQCQITVSGTGVTGGFFGGLGQFDLAAVLTADPPGAASNGFGGECYPVTGSLTLTPAYNNRNPGALVVDVQGQDCAVGSSPTLSVISATYVVDATNSAGRFAGATGTGTISASLDASQSPPAVGFTFSGGLQGANNDGGRNGNSKISGERRAD